MNIIDVFPHKTKILVFDPINKSANYIRNINNKDL